jgi:TPR repeat protein
MASKATMAEVDGASGIDTLFSVTVIVAIVVGAAVWALFYTVWDGKRGESSTKTGGTADGPPSVPLKPVSKNNKGGGGKPGSKKDVVGGGLRGMSTLTGDTADCPPSAPRAKNNNGGRKKGSKKDGAEGGLVCANCKTVGELDTMKSCGRCRRVWYCSVACQKIHWKGGGHKKVCGKKGGSGDRSDGVSLPTRPVSGASGGGGAAFKHPCPICLGNEDNAGDSGMCNSCGQTFCGSCKESMQERDITSCPTCRASFDVSPKEDVRRLRQLLARPTGRHTPTAQFMLGLHYGMGAGVAQDDAEWARRCRLAADQGHAEAQHRIGRFYADGTVFARDDAEAVRWYRLAADQGLVRAQFALGICYGDGTGVARDNVEAVRWHRLAADQGFAKAQVDLGACYGDGTGVARDDVEAARWYRLAADQGYATAQFALGRCYALGIGVARNDVEAARWFRLAAAQGFADALTALTQLGM